MPPVWLKEAGGGSGKRRAEGYFHSNPPRTFGHGVDSRCQNVAKIRKGGGNTMGPKLSLLPSLSGRPKESQK